MASELYNAMGTSANNAQVQQNPREQAMNLLKQRGINVPDNISNNPQAIIQHLMQSGQVQPNRLQMAQQMMQRMFRR